MMKRIVVITLFFLLFQFAGYPHGGGLDRYGGHHDRIHGGYHYHRQKKEPTYVPASSYTTSDYLPSYQKKDSKEKESDWSGMFFIFLFLALFGGVPIWLILSKLWYCFNNKQEFCARSEIIGGFFGGLWSEKSNIELLKDHMEGVTKISGGTLMNFYKEYRFLKGRKIWCCNLCNEDILSGEEHYKYDPGCYNQKIENIRVCKACYGEKTSLIAEKIDEQKEEFRKYVRYFAEEFNKYFKRIMSNEEIEELLRRLYLSDSTSITSILDKDWLINETKWANRRLKSFRITDDNFTLEMD